MCSSVPPPRRDTTVGSQTVGLYNMWNLKSSRMLQCFFAAALFAVGQSHPGPNRQSPLCNNNPTHAEIFLVPHPSFCNAFYTCTIDGDISAPCTFCGEGLFFDKEEGSCVDQQGKESSAVCSGRPYVMPVDQASTQTSSECWPFPGQPNPHGGSGMSRRSAGCGGGGGGCGGGSGGGNQGRQGGSGGCGGSGGSCGGGSGGGSGGRGGSGGSGGGSGGRGGSGSNNNRGGNQGGGGGDQDPLCASSPFSGQSGDGFQVGHPSLCNAFFTCSPDKILGTCTFCPETMYFDESSGACVSMSDESICGNKEFAQPYDQEDIRTYPMCNRNGGGSGGNRGSGGSGGNRGSGGSGGNSNRGGGGSGGGNNGGSGGSGGNRGGSGGSGGTMGGSGGSGNRGGSGGGCSGGYGGSCGGGNQGNNGNGGNDRTGGSGGGCGGPGGSCGNQGGGNQGGSRPNSGGNQGGSRPNSGGNQGGNRPNSGGNRGGSGNSDPRCANSPFAGQNEAFFIPHPEFCNAFYTCGDTGVEGTCTFCPVDMIFSEDTGRCVQSSDVYGNCGNSEYVEHEEKEFIRESGCTRAGGSRPGGNRPGGNTGGNRPGGNNSGNTGGNRPGGNNGGNTGGNRPGGNNGGNDRTGGACSQNSNPFTNRNQGSGCGGGSGGCGGGNMCGGSNTMHG